MSVTPSLLLAYQNAEYLVFTKQQHITLRIGEFNPHFSQLMKEYEATSFAFISACNPRSQPHPDDANKMRHHNFQSILREKHFRFLEGRGQSADQQWQEISLLIWNVTQKQAEEWGCYLEQNALLWGANDAIPRLILCDV